MKGNRWDTKGPQPALCSGHPLWRDKFGTAFWSLCRMIIAAILSRLQGSILWMVKLQHQIFSDDQTWQWKISPSGIIPLELPFIESIRLLESSSGSCAHANADAKNHDPWTSWMVQHTTFVLDPGTRSFQALDSLELYMFLTGLIINKPLNNH